MSETTPEQVGNAKSGGLSREVQGAIHPALNVAWRNKRQEAEERYRRDGFGELPKEIGPERARLLRKANRERMLRGGEYARNKVTIAQLRARAEEAARREADRQIEAQEKEIRKCRAELAAPDSPERRKAIAAMRVLDPEALDQVLRDLDPERKAALPDIVSYVFENLELDKPDPGAAPSAGAWGLLKWATKTPENRSAFVLTIWPKLIPSRSKLEVEDPFKDDGSTVEQCIQRLRQLRQAAEPEQSADTVLSSSPKGDW